MGCSRSLLRTSHSSPSFSSGNCYRAPFRSASTSHQQWMDGWMDGWLSRNWSITLGQELQIEALETWCASLGERTNQRRGKPVPPPGWLGKGSIKMINTPQLWVLGHMLQHSLLHVEMTHLTLVWHVWHRPGSLNLLPKNCFRTRPVVMHTILSSA